MDLDRVTRETSSTPASSTTTSSASATATSAAESNSATQDALVDVGGVEAAVPASSTLSGRQVGVLANFGIGPENLDDEAQARMAHAIGRLDGMLACAGGDETACAALGPAPVGLTDASSADGSEQEILLEESDYTLSLRVSTDLLTGETTSRLLYIDADGTYISGLTNLPVETLFAPEPEPALEAESQPEDESWLSTLAGVDGDYDVLTRLGGAMQVAGGAADLAVAIPLLLAPEPVLTKVAAAGAGLRGLDDLQAGLQTVISGEPTETVTQTVATDAALAMGADPDSAKTIGLAVDMVTGILNPAGRLRHMTTEMSERLAKEAAEQAGRHSDDAAKGLRAAEDGLEDGSSAVSRATSRVLEADPVRTVLGSARESHPNLYDDLLREADELGVELIERPGMMAYSPSPRGGKPGQLFLDPDASISAVLHEMQHVRDDLAQSWPGMGKRLDKDTRWAMEEAAYRAEREFVEGLDTPGKQAVLEQLARNQEAERLAIYEDLP